MSRRFAAFLFFLMVMGAGAALYLFPRAHRLTARIQPPVFTKASSLSTPFFFESNQGQTDPRVKFLARGSGYGIFLTASEAVLKLQNPAPRTRSAGQATQPSAPSVVRMHLDGANPNAPISGQDQLPGSSNYFIGNDPSKWRRGIPQFARVEYKSVYPGIDLVYYGRQGQLEYDFHVAPSADPSQIALNFNGAARIDAGDLVLSTDHGDVRFHAPHIYQNDNGAQKDIPGRFRQTAENKVGFLIGAYDRSRELIIDPVLSYSTFLGGSNQEANVSIAVGPDNRVYVAGSTMSADFPVTSPNIQATLAPGATQNIFLSVIDPSTPTLFYSTYLGGNGIDTAAGVGATTHLDSSTTGFDIYVAGSTTSTNFPTTSSGFDTTQPTDGNTHSFVSRVNLSVTGASVSTTTLSYSTYLAGNGNDVATGLAVDPIGNAYVTGTTTSSNTATGFPSTTNAYQPCPWHPGVVNCDVSSGPKQFFVSKINTAGTGTQSMLYSTYFGGGWTSGTVDESVGGGITVDTSGNIYFTGGTNMPAVQGPNPSNFPFPHPNAQQSCLDEASKTVCSNATPPQESDAFVAKINPNVSNQAPVFSTFLGAEGNDVGYAVAVDGSGNVYVTGSTSSTQWVFPTTITPVQTANAGGANDAFLAKVANPGSGGSVFPLIYFTYLGDTGNDIGQAIAVDANQGAHIVGTTNSSTLPAATNANSGSTDAFIAFVSTTISFGSTTGSGDYTTFLGGTGAEVGSSIALDANNSVYVGGTTTSNNFPTKGAAVQTTLNNGGPDAFVSIFSASSSLTVSAQTNSPSPNPVAAGNQVAFTFDITNTGPDPATNVVFMAIIPATGLTSQSAKITSGGAGSCGSLVAGTTTSTITCTISSLAVHPSGTCTTGGVGCGAVEVDLTPSEPVVNPSFTVKGQVLSANGQSVNSQIVSQPSVSVTDFSVDATPAQQTVTAGQNTTFNVVLSPVPTYTATISMTDSGLPANSTATYSTSSVAMSGTNQATTTLSISTQPRPVTTGSLFRGHAFYAAWLPVGGLSLLGLGAGAGRKRRRWLAGALLGLIAAIILLQSACGSTNSSANNGGTPAGNYTITITATSGSVSHTKTVLLVVN